VHSFLINVKQFSEGLDNPDGVWIHYAPYGRWSHPNYGVTYMTVDKAGKMVKNFNENVRGQDILLDYEHGEDKAKGNKASGQIVAMEARSDGIWSKVKFTDTAKAEIKSGEWKYFSPQFHEKWKNPMNDAEYEAVAAGGGLTNRPWIKGMVPLNFSEVMVEVDDATIDTSTPVVPLRFRTVETRVGNTIIKTVTEVSEDGGNEWREATKDECVEWEHSEPGTGSPPTPRTDEDDKSGDLDGGGIRRDSPPPAFENNEEGSDMKLSKEALAALGLPEDATEDQVSDGIIKGFSELKVYKDKAAADDRQKSFAEQFPDEYAEMQRNKDERLSNDAKRFSENIKMFTETKGDGDNAVTTPTGKGFSALALEKIQATHVAINKGDEEGALKSFSEALTTITSNAGIVDYKEHGSNRENNDEMEVPSDRVEIGKKFSEAVKAVQVEAGGPEKMSWGDALAATASKHPELAKAYSEAFATKRD
jgi:hypothetical protein